MNEMQSDTATSDPAADAFLASTMRYIQFQKQKGGTVGEKYEPIKVWYADDYPFAPVMLDLWAICSYAGPATVFNCPLCIPTEESQVCVHDMNWQQKLLGQFWLRFTM